MTKKPQKSTPWREQRERRGRTQDYKKKARANRERHRRAKKGIFKKANDIFVDSQDNGYDRRVYVLLMNKRRSGIHYSTYNSHPQESWVPAAEDVVSQSRLMTGALSQILQNRRPGGLQSRSGHLQTLTNNGTPRKSRRKRCSIRNS